VLRDGGFDVIDLNFACPVRKALRRRRGGYLMSQPQQVLGIVRAVLAAADRPVTLKLRRRFAADDGDEAFWRIADGAFEAGAAAVCAHARSVEQKYAGPADWDFLREVKRRFAERTILASGDVLTPAAALEMLRVTGADAVAAARGALGNPWFFRQVRDLAAGREPCRPTPAEQRGVLEDHFAAACALYGERRGPRIMRKFGIRYARSHPRPAAVRQAFVAVRQPDDWAKVLEDYYGETDNAAGAAAYRTPGEPGKEE
jgi:tRNA-dihydrouridine synthase